MILLIDNYDSFVHNLARYLRRLGAEVLVLRNDSNELGKMAAQSEGIVISPGPYGPQQSGQCVPIVQHHTGRIPILGVCLGHQVIVHAFGGRVIRAQYPVHGRALPIQLSRTPLFEAITPVSHFARYHSLIAETHSLPSCLRVIAESLPWETIGDTYSESAVESKEAGAIHASSAFEPEIMAVEHREHPTFGVQFHPESILSKDGYRLLSNFLVFCGIPNDRPLPSSDLQTTTQG